MKYRANKITALLDKPGGAKVDDLLVNETVTGTGKTDGLFTEVDPGDGTHEWVLTADLTLLDDADRPIADRQIFIEECIHVERALNDLATTAPWFISADFLIARALIETDIKNAGRKVAGSDAVGPLQVSSAEWNDFLANGGPLKEGYGPGDFDNWVKQIRGAGYRMFSDAKSTSNLKQGKGGTATDPFLPSYLDVFHAYLLNSPGAAIAVLDAQNSDADEGKTIKEVLTGVLQAEQLTAVFNARASFTGTVDQPKSLADFVTATQSALDGALKSAHDLIQQFAPQELPAVTQAEAPWFDVAQDEEKKNIAEPNDRIRTEYFPATDYRPNPPPNIPSWCGAFASYCMKASGSELAAKSIPKGSAVAANWKGWGASLSAQADEIPSGAVVVLSPAPGTTSSGHVGFFVKFQKNNEQVVLLGGNQSHQVVEKPFPASRIVAIRWLDLAPGTKTEQPADAPSDAPSAPSDSPTPQSDSPISQRAIDLIVASEVSSRAAYEKFYQKPTWPQGASGVTIGIGYDVGYATGGGLRDDWSGLVPAPMVQALQGAVGVTGGAASGLAAQLRGSVNVPWDAAMSVFMKRDVPKWVGIVKRALPNADALNPDCLGALVSLAYNRGASFSKAGSRYTEMRNIKACMADKNFAGIPQELRNMARLWPNLRGLRVRREQEAQLFEQGLARMKGG
jgi:uncharacterized protein (TIGR02594 family)